MCSLHHDRASSTHETESSRLMTKGIRLRWFHREPRGHHVELKCLDSTARPENESNDPHVLVPAKSPGSRAVECGEGRSRPLGCRWPRPAPSSGHRSQSKGLGLRRPAVAPVRSEAGAFRGTKCLTRAASEARAPAFLRSRGSDSRPRENDRSELAPSQPKDVDSTRCPPAGL